MTPEELIGLQRQLGLSDGKMARALRGNGRKFDGWNWCPLRESNPPRGPAEMGA